MRQSLSRAAVQLLVAGALLSAAVFADGSQWAYSGTRGPDHWGELDPQFSTCATGKNQSPIDLASPVDVDLKPIDFSYAAGGKEIFNNGHTVQVSFQGGSTITVDGQVYELKQLHFHVPSENRIRGESFPMEAHLVHADPAGHLAVIAVMWKEGAASPALAQLWSRMPMSAGPTRPLPAAISAEALLPHDRRYYSFSGSLTTPPCTEGVRWLLMKQPNTASKSQIEGLLHALGHPNNRPVQLANGRVEQE